MASIVVAGDTSGTVTLAAPAVSGTTTLTLPTTSGTIVTTSGSQTIEFADGSASTPSITNSGDTNTGMFFPAADTIAFAEGGVEAMRLDASGRVTKPFQTAFLAQAVQTDTTYSGVGTLIPFPNEVFDIGNNYDASISRFTAPVTGIYLVSWSCWNTSATTSRSALYKNGSVYKSSVNSDPISTRHNGGGDQANGVTIPVQLSVGDYIEVRVYGNAITQFWMNYFSAYLLG